MVQKLRERSQGEGGFTLVELLVVMLILGLLAAIAIPSFFNQRDKARDADSKASVRTAQTAVESIATDNPNGQYTMPGGAAITPADLIAVEETLAGGNITSVTGGTDSYSVTSTSDTGNTFTIARASNGTVTYTCTVPSGNGRAGCPVGNTWAQ